MHILDKGIAKSWDNSRWFISLQGKILWCCAEIPQVSHVLSSVEILTFLVKTHKDAIRFYLLSDYG